MSSPSSTWFDKESRLCIPVEPSSVHFLHTPDEFYNTLLQRISSARKRVVLAALYLGSGGRERELVARLEKALVENSDLEVSILLDFFRGTRGSAQDQSSTAMLGPLTANKNVKVSLFHTPEMRGMLRTMLPERVNEVCGLQHMKFFVFDDAVLISGANLSDQYFVNRQDRYLLIENCPILADFFVSTFELISAHSFQLGTDSQLEFADGAGSSIHPKTGSMPVIQQRISNDVDQLYAKFTDRLAKSTHQSAPTNSSKSDRSARPSKSDGNEETFVCPFLQMGMFNIEHEVELFRKLFECDNEQLNVTMMTAYFNLYDTYADLIVDRCRFPVNLVFGSPESNGFYGAGGLSGHIPSLYLHNALEFVRRTFRGAQEKRISCAEWHRAGWTFHAKGLWVDNALDGGRTSATVVGSSNFGFRSVHKDLEAQLLLVTDNEALKKRIAEERNSLMEHVEPLDLNAFLRRDPLIPSWVKGFARFFRNFF